MQLNVLMKIHEYQRSRPLQSLVVLYINPAKKSLGQNRPRSWGHLLIQGYIAKTFFSETMKSKAYIFRKRRWLMISYIILPINSVGSKLTTHRGSFVYVGLQRYLLSNHETESLHFKH